MPDIRIVGVIRILNRVLDGLNLAGETAAGKLIDGFHNLHHVFFRILIDKIYCLAESEFSKSL